MFIIINKIKKYWFKNQTKNQNQTIQEHPNIIIFLIQQNSTKRNIQQVDFA